MSKIITITLNPAVDHNILIGKFKTGDVTRAREATVTAAGKGINVARTVSGLGKQVTAFCFVGRNESHIYKQLRSKYFNLHLFPVSGTTRSNITVVDSGHHLVIHLQTNGFPLTEVLLQPLYPMLEKLSSEGDVVAFSGSTPEGVPVDFYQQMIAACNRKGCRVIFDSSGKYFKHGLGGIPHVIKPNMEELEELSGKKLSSLDDVVRESKALNEKGIELVFVSRGKKGVILTRKNHPGYWTANVKLPPRNPEGNEIGCGDAMIGGIALSLSYDYETEDILRMAVACGAANLLSKGPGVCEPADVKALFSQASVRHYK
jgi:1-phosphofructokinase family hexose kinase